MRRIVMEVISVGLCDVKKVQKISTNDIYVNLNLFPWCSMLASSITRIRSINQSKFLFEIASVTLIVDY
jgi:hypothetical protein